MPDIKKNDWEYLDLKKTKIPAEIRNSNDAEQIGKWVEIHRAELDEKEVQALAHRQESCRKLSQKISAVKKAVADENYQEKKADALILEDEQMYLLNDINQPSFQTSDNGCWSCFYQMVLQSRGITDLTGDKYVLGVAGGKIEQMKDHIRDIKAAAAKDRREFLKRARGEVAEEMAEARREAEKSHARNSIGATQGKKSQIRKPQIRKPQIRKLRIRKRGIRRSRMTQSR